MAAQAQAPSSDSASPSANTNSTSNTDPNTNNDPSTPVQDTPTSDAGDTGTSTSTSTAPPSIVVQVQVQEPSNHDEAASPEDNTSSTPAQPPAITKSSLRKKVWQHMNTNRLSLKQPWHSFTHSIPNFVNSGEAVNLLKSLDEFKNATHVMVNPDRSQYGVRMACLQENKILYVMPPRFLDYLMTSYKPKEGATESDLEEALIVKNLTETKNRITVDKLENVVPLDLIVIGSVAVTRDGRHLGIGRGYMDFYLALLTQLKLLTPQTTIVTTVHDSQVLDSAPSELFGSHDFSVDIIVTPTEVIRTEKTFTRPSGIIWNMISDRRLKRLQVVNHVREKEIQEGNQCVLKEEDSDHESDGNHGPRKFFRGRRYIHRRRPMYNRTNGTTNESDNYDNAQENGSAQPRKMNPYRRYYQGYRNNNDVPSKRTFRDKAWQLLKISKVCTTRRTFYDQIPGFKGSEDADQKLRETELYKNATNILVTSDRNQEQFRQFCLEDGKKLFILMLSAKKGILRIDFPEGEEVPDFKTVNTREGFEKFGTKLTLEDKFHIDLIVIGSAAVSKDGFRIGTGHGDLDIYYGLLTHMEAVNSETSIATTVHNCQIFETFPDDIIKEHDMPVNMIVAPTQIIEAKHTEREHKGIYWNMLTEKRLKFFPELKTLRDQLIEGGTDCTLKEDTRRPPRYGRYSNYKNASENETNEPVESDQQNNGNKVNGHKRFTKKRYNGHHYYMRGDVENMSPDSTTNRPKRAHKRKQYDFCIKVSNIQRTFNAKDLKNALEERKVKPAYVKWNGFKGYSLLYFSKPNTQAEPETFNPDSILDSLANLTLYPNVSNPESTNPESSSEPPLPNKLVVQMGRMRPLRIETAEQTAV